MLTLIIYVMLSLSTACGCNHPQGARGRRCDMTTGQCTCRPDITGRTCDTCVMEGFYGPINRQCRKCSCVAENTNECNRVKYIVLYGFMGDIDVIPTVAASLH